MFRQPAVAGQFYPLGGSQLERQVTSLLPEKGTCKQALGALVPHAGYVYSGSVAAEVYGEIEIPSRVIILGPNHHGIGKAGAVYARGAWSTPLGTTPVAETLALELLDCCSLLSDDAGAHRHEHSLEVQLPFLQVLRPDVEILPVCLGRLNLDALVEIGTSLAEVVSRQEETVLLLASSDMSHYEPSEVARRKDHQAIARMLELDPEGLLRVVQGERISMCGVLPAVAMLVAARQLGAASAELVRYATSGDVTGDQSEVVGYAGLVIC